MAAGFKALLDKTQINTKIGGISVRLREVFDEIEQFNEFFQQEGVAGLVANFGFDPTDTVNAPDANLVGTVNNLYELLRQVYLGAQTVDPAVNFRQFSPQVEALR
jgi:hypothetical protein